MTKLFIIIVILTGFPVLAFEIKTNCDIPGGDLKNFSSPNPKSCEDQCTKLENCKAFVFISGWNRCVLKSKISRQVAVRLYAGQKDGKNMSKPKQDSDHKGKDLRRVSAVMSAGQCGEKCLEESQCQAYSYIAGYHDCWLKKNKANFQDKIFSCGVIR